MKNVGDKFEFEGIFRGFTNTTYNTMFVEHTLNNSRSAIQMPAIFEIKDPALISRAKVIPLRSILKLAVTRKTDGTNLAAELCDFEILIRPKKPKTKPAK